MKNSVILGLIIAGLGIITTLLYRFVIGYEFMFSMKSVGISLLLTLVIVIFLGRKLLRDPEEGRLGYGQAVKKLFVAFMVSSVVSIIFTTMLFGNDQEMKNAFSNHEIEIQENAARLGASMAGQTEAEQEEAVERLREARESGEIKPGSYPYSWKQFPISLLSAAVMYLLVSLLLALFVREKETQFA